MECKGFYVNLMSQKCRNWNISRMECKDNMIKLLKDCMTNWNISRMECKVISTQSPIDW